CGLIDDVGRRRLSGVRWLPSPLSVRVCLPVPTLGTLDDFDRRYSRLTERLGTRLYGSITVRSRQVWYAESCLPRAFVAFELRRPDAPLVKAASLPEDTVAVAAMLRSLVCDVGRYGNRRAFQAEFPGVDSAVYLAGHVPAR